MLCIFGVPVGNGSLFPIEFMFVFVGFLIDGNSSGGIRYVKVC